MPEGDDASFEVNVAGVQELPVELETVLLLQAFGVELRSSSAEASTTPSGWAFEDPAFRRPKNGQLLDDIAGRRLKISLLDAGAGDAVIGTAELDLVPLLHESHSVGGEVKLELVEDYHQKWFPPPPSQEGGDEENAPASPVPVGGTPDEKASRMGSKASVVPEAKDTVMSITISVAELVGPREDAGAWSILSVSLAGVYALPSQLSGFGVSGDDVENHQLAYTTWIWGEKFKDGALARAKEKREAVSATEAGDEPPPEEIEEDWRITQERFGISVQFPGESGPRVRYVGKTFLDEFHNMLNHTGGVWMHLLPEEKPPLDPKKANSPEASVLAKHFSGKAWVDLRDFIVPGASQVESCSTLVSTSQDPEKEETLESARTFVKIRTELRVAPVSADNPMDKKDILELIPEMVVHPLHSSSDAAEMYVENVANCVERVCSDLTDGVTGRVAGAVDRLRQKGKYEAMKKELRKSVIQVFRERLKKDTSIVPGKKLEDLERDEFYSNVYVYLKSVAEEVIKKLQQSPPAPTVAEALVESARAREVRDKLRTASRDSYRFACLAYEAELVGNMARAEQLIQNRLVLEEHQRDPAVWLEYAKFSMRKGGSQAVAEEALRQALFIMDGGTDRKAHVTIGELLEPRTDASATTSADNVRRQARLMLTCLLLDRGRDSEAVAAFEEWHRQDLADPFINFLLGLTRFLTGDEEGARLLFLAVSKERQWFAGLPDDTAISDKVKLYNDGEAILDDPKPYVACLEQLLDFCIPSLVFTFLDQTKTLPDEVLALPEVALVDAKASALQKDYAAAAERIERSLADNDGASSFGAWWLAGECHFQLRAYDKALHALQQAIAADANPSDPAVFIRQGHVLLLKKRWPQARDAFLRSIRCKPTAESWSGVAHAEYRSEHLHTCYEALCEASLLDNERWDIWGQLVLLHLRNENSSLADQCFRQCLVQGPDSDELLLEIAGEYNKRKCGTTAAEAAVRFAMQIRDSGSARALMAEAIWNQNESEEAVLLAEEAIRLLQDQPEQRRAIFEKASGWCSALNKPALMGSLEAVNKKAGDTGSPISPLSLRSPRN